MCVFDGLENVREKCGRWYEEQLSEKAAGEMVREEIKESKPSSGSNDPSGSQEGIPSARSAVSDSQVLVELPEGLEIIEAEPIVDRKSSFIGRACRITSPDQVGVAYQYVYHAILTPCLGPSSHFLPPIRPENCSSGPPGHPCLALSSRQCASPGSVQFYRPCIRPDGRLSSSR